MGYVAVGLIIFIAVGLLLGLLGGIPYLIYLPFKKRLLKSGKLTKKSSRQIDISYVSLLILFGASQTYFAFFPTDGFYRDEFTYNTKIELPPSAKIINKDSWYPDMHGSYWAAAVIQLNPDDYARIKKTLAKKHDFKTDTTSQKIGITEEYDKVTKKIRRNDIEIVFLDIKQHWFKVAFLKDRKTIIFEKSN